MKKPFKYKEPKETEVITAWLLEFCLGEEDT